METFHPKLILCPTDYSEPATLALHYGKLFAECFNGRMVVLYADSISPPPYFTSGQIEDLAKEIGRFKGAAHKHLTRYVREQIGSSSEVEMVVAENQTVPAILLTAEEKKVDMIVMGTHGRSGFNRLMLGSITEKVLHETNHPVLTIREKKISRNCPKSPSNRCYAPSTIRKLPFRPLNTPLRFRNVLEPSC